MEKQTVTKEQLEQFWAFANTESVTSQAVCQRLTAKKELKNVVILIDTTFSVYRSAVIHVGGSPATTSSVLGKDRDPEVSKRFQALTFTIRELFFGE